MFYRFMNLLSEINGELIKSYSTKEQHKEIRIVEICMVVA